MRREGWVRRCNGLPYECTRPLPDGEKLILARRRRRARLWGWFWITAAGGCLAAMAWSAISNAVTHEPSSWSAAGTVACIIGVLFLPVLALHQFTWAALLRKIAAIDKMEVYRSVATTHDRWWVRGGTDLSAQEREIAVSVPARWYMLATVRGAVVSSVGAEISLTAECSRDHVEGVVPLTEDERRELSGHLRFFLRRLVEWAMIEAAILGVGLWSFAHMPALTTGFVALVFGTNLLRFLASFVAYRRLAADLAEGLVHCDPVKRSAVLPRSEMDWVVSGLPASWRFSQPWLKPAPAEMSGVQ